MVNRLGLVALWAALLALLAGAPEVAEARQGFFLGVGLAQQSAKGDLDGSHVVTNSAGTEALSDGSLDSGGGIALDIGYGFNNYIGVELMLAATSNTSSAPGLPDTTAAVGSDLLGLRLTLPVGSALDLLARVGVSGHAVIYPDRAFQGTQSGGTFVASGPGKGNATFGGGGTAWGLGAEIFMGHVGLGLGWTEFTADINQASGGGISGSLPKTLHETFTVADLTVAYHF